jgi:FAD/FMN-containing dehydrogenase
MLGHGGRIKEALAPWSRAGHYLNFVEDAVDTAATYGASAYRRLQAVKARVDPENVLHANHEIVPAE